MFAEILRRRVYGCQGLLAWKLWLCNGISSKLASGLRADVCRQEGEPGTSSLLPSSLSCGGRDLTWCPPAGRAMRSRPARLMPWIPAPGVCEGLSGLLGASGRTPVNALGRRSCGWGRLPGWRQARSGGRKPSVWSSREEGWGAGPPVRG